jgi:hypothetical protein
MLVPSFDLPVGCLCAPSTYRIMEFYSLNWAADHVCSLSAPISFINARSAEQPINIGTPRRDLRRRERLAISKYLGLQE